MNSMAEARPAATPTSRHHVVAIPYPAQGHFSPMLQLCEQLAARGFSFTFINTHHIHHRLLHAGKLLPDVSDVCPLTDVQHDRQDYAASVASHCDDTALDHTAQPYSSGTYAPWYHYNCKESGCIRMMFVAGGCAPELHAHTSTTKEAFQAAGEMREPVERLLPGIMKEQRVSFFMSDILLDWSSATAEKFGLPWVSFWAASTASLSALIYFSSLGDQGDAGKRIAEMEAEGAPLIEAIPGLPPTRLPDLPKLWNDSGSLLESFCKIFEAPRQASCLLLNTFADIEGQVVEALSKLRFPVRAVGPLLPSRDLFQTCPDSSEKGTLISRPSLFAEDRTCLTWLDMHVAGSVLFISFGSISLRSEEQLQELANGIEASGCPFLWVCKPDIESVAGQHKGGQPAFTHEAIARRNPRGLIVPWAPQLQVLSHPAVGGFITHCGWNSVVESISMGVPMLCWADTGERMCNQRFVVEVWKCGIHMVADTKRRDKQHIDEGVLVSRDDVEKSIRFLMLEERGAALRLRSAQLRDAAIEAYRQSSTQLDEFAETMKQV